MNIKMQGIKIVGVPFDGSGYGQGLRTWIHGLVRAGVPIWIQPISFEKDRPDLNDKVILPEGHTIVEKDLYDSLCRQPVPYDINFVRLSPEVAVNFLDRSAINICSCAWETERLDSHWVECCNRFHAVFVESEWLVKVFKKSGVIVPIQCVPNAIDVSKFNVKTQPNLTKTYKFYSIQQWTERKNGLGLLKSYFNAFTAKDDVLLVLKTYLTRVEVREDQKQKLREDIDNLKRALNFDRDFPPVYLISDKLSTEQIIKMHEDCDCYVMLDRGEGFGLPYMEAAAAGNPIIATDYAGTREFLNKDNSYCVPWQPTYVCNMEWSPYYRGNDGGTWAEPNLIEAASLMRQVFDDKQKAFLMGQKARQTVTENFNLGIITNRLLEALASVIHTARS